MGVNGRYHVNMAAIHGEQHNMKVTSAGQISLPAEVRRRWGTSRVRIVDHGDHLVVEPAPDDPIAALRGCFAHLAGNLTSGWARRLFREEEVEAELRKYGPS